VRAQRYILNALPNILWTAIFIGPVYAYCVREIPPRLLYVFAVAGALPFLVPRSFLQRFQLSPDTGVYRRLQLPLLVKLTQDAPWLHRLGGHPEKRVRRDRGAIVRVISDTWTRERFHFGLLVFCALCAGVALWRTQLMWFTALILINTLYNLYPVWVQQYLRLRVTHLLGKRLPGEEGESSQHSLRNKP
jgi:Glycosyl-4,4'-diaponeurosporenoate acyltransferase